MILSFMKVSPLLPLNTRFISVQSLAKGLKCTVFTGWAILAGRLCGVKGVQLQQSHDPGSSVCTQQTAKEHIPSPVCVCECVS